MTEGKKSINTKGFLLHMIATHGGGWNPLLHSQPIVLIQGRSAKYALVEKHCLLVKNLTFGELT